MQQMSKALKEKVTSAKKNKIDWDQVRLTIGLIRRAGGDVVNQHKRSRTFQLPRMPGIRLLGYGDFLKSAGFRRIYSEDEIKEIEALRIGGARF